VSALVRSELLKIRTTRSWWAYLIAIVAITAIGTAGEVGTATGEERDAADFLVGLVDIVSVTALVSVILGIVIVTSEFRHGTITPTLLATPSRSLVLGAKAVTAIVVAIGFALLSLVIVAAVALPWLAAVDAPTRLGDGELVTGAATQVLAIALSALVGIAIGTVVHNQVAALVGTLAWIFVIENLLWGLFALLDVDAAVQYLPFRALDAADASDGSGGDEMLSQGPAIAVSAVWIALIGAAGTARTRRRDIT
jgi:ABC-2 type transport system permease protein